MGSFLYINPSVNPLQQGVLFEMEISIPKPLLKEEWIKRRYIEIE